VRGLAAAAGVGAARHRTVTDVIGALAMSSTGPPLLEAHALHKRLCQRPELAVRYAAADIWDELRVRSDRLHALRPGEFWAVQDVSLRLHRGEVLGIVGHNGAGKSTLLNLIAGIIRPTLGEVRWHTNSVVLMDVNAGLNPVQSGRENIRNKLALHGFSRERIDSCVDAVAEYADLGSFIDAAVGTFSTGMRLRLAFSIYTRIQPDVFIVDEALGGGDLQFRQKFESHLRAYVDAGGAMLLISHDLFVVQSLCHRCILLDGGRVLADGPTLDVLRQYHQTVSARGSRAQVSATPIHAADASGPSGIETSSAPVTPVVTQASKGGSFDQVAILDARIEAVDGGILMPGGRARIRLCCQSTITLSPVWIGLMLRGDGPRPVAITVGGQGDRPYALKVGINEYTGHIEELPLMPGHYWLIPSVLNGRTHAILGVAGHDHPSFPFEVHPSADPSLQLALGQKALLHLPVAWS
jgi:lipopolysaccharide transport system ATP-binding protein